MEFPDYRQYLTYIPQPIRTRGRDFAAVTASLFLIRFFPLLCYQTHRQCYCRTLRGDKGARKKAISNYKKKLTKLLKRKIFITKIYDRLFW